MNPQTYAETGTEHAHQTALFIWASTMRKDLPVLEWLFAIPNGGERNKIVASRMKAEGVKSGVSDVCLPVASKGFHGLFIEMKKPGELKKESDNQKKFGSFLNDQEYYYACVDHWEKARDILLWYLV